MTAGGPGPALFGGVVAFNEEARVQRAIRSLLDQELPMGARWEEVCVVASGCTDRTAQRVRELAASDPRVTLVEQPRREGKSAALGELFARARGDALVLLNGDAVAAPDAVRRMLDAAPPELDPPWAVMGRAVPEGGAGPISDALGLLWRLHHRLHARVLAEGSGTHLSDELMLLPVDRLPALPTGIVNDGAFLGASLRRDGGTLRYADGAVVTVAVPRTWAEHVRQRRRILYGHRQVRDRTGVTPTTLEALATRNPSAVIRILLEESRASARPLRSMGALALAEALALLLARSDGHTHQVDHVRWARIADAPEPSAGRTVPTEP